ncbi:putative glyceraldehyde-3-phosphate dehydrogenase (phosphorylating) [Helianthus annuus]|nr:putative glyceraldehyde-3-phosphate dehydrogenase (phosphorylating) [Helianthus annuus]
MLLSIWLWHGRVQGWHFISCNLPAAMVSVHGQWKHHKLKVNDKKTLFWPEARYCNCVFLKIWFCYNLQSAYG